MDTPEKLLAKMFRLNREIMIMQQEANDVAEDHRLAPCRVVSPYPDNDNSINRAILD